MEQAQNRKRAEREQNEDTRTEQGENGKRTGTKQE